MECEESFPAKTSEKFKRDRSYCVVPKCGSQGSRHPELSFFRFPKAQYDENGCVTFKGIQNLLRKKDWTSVLGLGRSISDRAVVCSKHFKAFDFTPDHCKKRRLKLNAVPSMFLPDERTKQNDYVDGITEDWQEDETASLIALYKMKKCLYDKTDIDYADSAARSQAYKEIQNIMSKMRPGCTIREIMYMISLLRSQYTVEKREKEKCIESGSSTEEISKTWPLGLLKFLDDHIKPSEKQESKEDENANARDNLSLEGDDSYPETVKILQVELKEDVDVMHSENSISNSEADLKDQPLTTTPTTIKISRQLMDTFQTEEESSLPANENADGLEEDVSECSTVSVESSDDVEENIEGQMNKKKSVKNPDERDDIFGRYVASKMKILKRNTLLQLQTEQAILEVLSSATSKLFEKKTAKLS